MKIQKKRCKNTRNKIGPIQISTQQYKVHCSFQTNSCTNGYSHRKQHIKCFICIYNFALILMINLENYLNVRSLTFTLSLYFFPFIFLILCFISLLFLFWYIDTVLAGFNIALSPASQPSLNFAFLFLMWKINQQVN